MSVLRLVYLSIILIKVQYIKQRLMKKFLFFLLTSLLASTAVLRAETLTVNDGTEPSSYVPVYGNWVDELTHTQFIVARGNIEEQISGKSITQLIFYSSTNSASWGAASFDVSIMTYPYSTLGSSWESLTGATLVYSGSLSVVSNTLTVNFETPFLYTGGNLLIDITQKVKGSYNYVSFYGKSGSYGSSMYGYNSSRNTAYFCPKMTFTYGGGASCAQPGTPAVSNITSAGATFTWSAATDVDQYQYCVVAKGTTPNWAAASSTSATSVTLTSLSANTSYDFYVRSYCDEENQSSAKKVTFTTDCEVITVLPWTESFDIISGIPSCWDNSIGNATNKWTYFYDGQDNEGGSMMFDSDNNQRDKTNTLSTPTIRLGDKSYQLSFWYKNKSAGDCQLYINGTLVDGATYGNTYNSWEKKVVSLNDYANNDIQIAWKGISNYGYGSYIWIDNILVEQISNCQTPTSLSATNVRKNAVDLSWTAGGDETKWELQYKSVSEGEWTAVPGQLTSINYTLTGLSSGIDYEIQVRACCEDDEQSAWSSSTFVSTLCAELSLYTTYGFESDAEGSAPRCWTTHRKTGVDMLPRVDNDGVNYNKYSRAGSQCVKIEATAGNHAWVVMPALDDEVDVNSLQVKAWIGYGSNSSASENNTYCEIGVMTDPSNLNTFQRCGYDVYARPNKVENPMTKVKLDKITNGGKYIAFYVKANITLGLDEVTVSYILTTPDNIVVSDITQNSAHVTFEQEKSLGKWQYKCYPKNSAEPSDASAVEISSTSFDLSDLTAETAYTLKLRHVDEENGEYSDWVDADFETASSWILPTNVQVVDVDVHTATITFEQVDGKSVGWTYQYAQTPDFTGTTLTERTTPSTTVNLEELSEGRTYYFRVHQTGHKGHWTSAVSFTTDCSPLMYGETYTFDDQENKRVPACWTNLHQDNLDYTSTVFEADSYNYAHSGTKALRINAYGDAGYFQTIAMPAVADDQDIKEIILEFWVMGSVNSGTLENCVLEVGVMTDADDKNTFTAVESFTPDGSWRLHSTNFSSYTGTGKHIAFRTIGNKPGYNYKFFIDDLMLNKKELIRHHPSTTQYGTICLNKRTIDLEGATFWKIAYKTQDLKYIMIEQVSELEAGRAYIFMPEQENLYGVMVGEAVQSPVAAADNNGLQGTFEAIVAAETNALTGNYMLYNNAFMECGRNCSMPANRAYMVLSAVCLEADAAPQQAPRRALGSGVSQTTTALDNLSENAIGVQKKIVDGRLYIVREGKTYDVDGRLVK